MGKRIIQQARGKGSSTYRVKKRAFRFRLQYPSKLVGEGEVVKIFSSPGHSAPLAKIKTKDSSFYAPAHKNMFVGQKVSFEKSEENKTGDILELKDIPVKTPIYNIESRPRDGGKFMKSGGNSAMISRIIGDTIFVMFPSKKERKFNKSCRATLGVVAGAGRLDKPFVKAGNKYHLKKAKSKLWPRTSARKVNAIDHPFGSGRGKVPKSKIAKRNSSPGQKVGLLRPRRTGKRK
jgi:large subunit ribosomal protein L2